MAELRGNSVTLYGLVWVLMHREELIPARSLGTLMEHPALEEPFGQQGVGQWGRAVSPHQPGERQDST